MFTGTATPNLGLPQWEANNHPDFLTDMNDAFKKIDENAGQTSGDVGQIAGIQKEVAYLQSLTQSLNEDSQQMIGNISAINIALGNLRTETDKIEPIQTQVLGLQEIARRQSDQIHALTEFQYMVKDSGFLDDIRNEMTFTDSASGITMYISRLYAIGGTGSIWIKIESSLTGVTGYKLIEVPQTIFNKLLERAGITDGIFAAITLSNLLIGNGSEITHFMSPFYSYNSKKFFIEINNVVNTDNPTPISLGAASISISYQRKVVNANDDT